MAGGEQHRRDRVDTSCAAFGQFWRGHHGSSAGKFEIAGGEIVLVEARA